MRPFAELVLPAIRWDPRNGFESAMPVIDEAKFLGVGGFIIFGGERDAVLRLTTELQLMFDHPLLIAADLERGAGQQVRGLHQLPPPLALASAEVDNREAHIWDAGVTTACEARLVGINWVLAPVLDLDIEPANPIVQTRSFGADPRLVAEYGARWIEGCQAPGVLACAKHFPGHGRTVADSHLDLPLVAADRMSLNADLMPFRRAVEVGAASIMTAHVAYPALDPSGVPATYSRAIVTDLLRHRMEYDGLVVTDALIMEGARKGVTEAEGAVRALAAGCDLLLYPKDVTGTVAAIEAAAADGTLPLARLEEAMARRTSAAARATSRVQFVQPPPWMLDERASGHVARSLRVLRGELARLRGPVGVHVVDDDIGGPYPLPARSAFAAVLRERGIEIGEGGDRVVLLFADVKSWKGRAGLKPFVRHQLAAHLETPATVVLFGHPRHVAEIPGDHPVLCAWSGDEVMQRAAAHFLLDA